MLTQHLTKKLQPAFENEPGRALIYFVPVCGRRRAGHVQGGVKRAVGGVQGRLNNRIVRFCVSVSSAPIMPCIHDNSDDCNYALIVEQIGPLRVNTMIHSMPHRVLSSETMIAADSCLL